MFGFQLSNIIPGFPRHSLYFVEPPYELQATQHCENGQVRSVRAHRSSVDMNHANVYGAAESYNDVKTCRGNPAGLQETRCNGLTYIRDICPQGDRSAK